LICSFIFQHWNFVSICQSRYSIHFDNSLTFKFNNHFISVPVEVCSYRINTQYDTESTFITSQAFHCWLFHYESLPFFQFNISDKRIIFHFKCRRSASSYQVRKARSEQSMRTIISQSKMRLMRYHDLFQAVIKPN
jgi:hypothetical protein